MPGNVNMTCEITLGLLKHIKIKFKIPKITIKLIDFCAFCVLSKFIRKYISIIISIIDNNEDNIP